jgi:hypothetical protein
MKRNTMMIIAAVMLLTGIGSVFASGNKDAAPQTPQAPFARGPQMNLASNDKVTLTGTVAVTNKFHPELKVDSKLYYLMVPRFALDDIEVKDGATVTVEGFAVTGVPMVGEEAEAVLVTKAVIDGKEYDIDRGFGGPMMGGDGRGMGPGRWGDDGPQGGRRGRW